MLLSPPKKVIFDMLFPFLPVGLKWKVAKNVHCPLLLIDTGLMSIGPLTKKLLQKHRPVSYSKKRRKHALSTRPLTGESELSWLDAHWDGLCGLVLITLSENYEKEGCETWSALPFWRSHGLDFFGASRFGVIAVYHWMGHKYRKLNQFNPALQGRSGIHFQPGSVMLKTSPPPIPIQPPPTVMESG